jgi:hypothetical protein
VTTLVVGAAAPLLFGGVPLQEVARAKKVSDKARNLAGQLTGQVKNIVYGVYDVGA